uniref:V-type ATP synthase subunit I n=1 Tax=uncultured Draconibacterium sp. TaxID=1573823 RepID=UPI0032169230
MNKYTFWVYHNEYDIFLEHLQQLGILHVIEKQDNASSETDQKDAELTQLEKAIQYLSKTEIPEEQTNYNLDAKATATDIINKQEKRLQLEQELNEVKKEYDTYSIWGDFSYETINKLEKENLFVRFFTVSKKKFSENLTDGYHAEVIAEKNNRIYFVIITQGKDSVQIEADEVKLHKLSLSTINEQIEEIKREISEINCDIEVYAKSALPVLVKEKEEVVARLNYQKTVLNTIKEADDKIRILEGWVPEPKKKQIDSFLDQNDILYVIEKATEKDNVPVLIKNNRFSRLFEPIGKLFSLPAYAELDLTLFFAPFFMLFFGFCLGDAGYGLLFLVGAAIYKFKAKKELKPMLTLLQFLGLATVIFGIITGTFFGINLIETEVAFLSKYKNLFLNPDKMFNLALALGAIQIVFAMFVKAANQIKQYGFLHSLATFGWLIVILGTGAYGGLTQTGVLASNNTILYSILALGGFFILFFSDVNAGIFGRVGKGIWDIYSTVTGIFGDILSYIRLFALGLSSAILGFVINDIGMQILGSSKIIGPVFFVIFLILGHTLNILIASLGSFVHPMRLTFVEFYKNAGFKGGGKEYKPFRK